MKSKFLFLLMSLMVFSLSANVTLAQNSLEKSDEKVILTCGVFKIAGVLHFRWGRCRDNHGRRFRLRSIGAGLSFVSGALMSGYVSGSGRSIDGTYRVWGVGLVPLLGGEGLTGSLVSSVDSDKADNRQILLVGPAIGSVIDGSYTDLTLEEIK